MSGISVWVGLIQMDSVTRALVPVEKQADVPARGGSRHGLLVGQPPVMGGSGRQGGLGTETGYFLSKGSGVCASLPSSTDSDRAFGSSGKEGPGQVP